MPYVFLVSVLDIGWTLPPGDARLAHLCAWCVASRRFSRPPASCVSVAPVL